MRVGSYFPAQEGSAFYAMGADDCSLFFDLDRLTEKQQADHLANITLTAALQVALIALGKPIDHLALFDEFLKPPWSAMLERYRRQFLAAGFATVPPAHFVYGRKWDFYASLVDRVPPVDLVNLYMVSGSNAVLHKNPRALAISRNLNSKFHFAEHAPAFGIPVPETFVTTKSGLGGADTAAFLDRHVGADGAVMLKISGLAGARNVTTVSSLDEARGYVEQYGAGTDVLLQKKLDFAQFTELTVDLRITDRDITIANVRQILFADGLWVGNYIPKETPLTPAQEAVLRRVGEYARHHGLDVPEGANCGIDFFIGPHGEVIVTEINARWTGGLFPTQAVERVRPDGVECVVFFDIVPTGELDGYMSFVEAHAPGAGEEAFCCLALGFSPFEQEVAGRPHVYVWHVVMGDFAAFQSAKRHSLATGNLPTVDLIRLPA